MGTSAVYADGGICLDILQNQWSPIYDVSAILTSIQARSSCSYLNADSSHGTCFRCAKWSRSIHGVDSNLVQRVNIDV